MRSTNTCSKNVEDRWDELRSDRRAETQRKGSCATQFFIREQAYCGGRLMTVPTQEFERGGLRYLSMLVGMLWLASRNLAESSLAGCHPF
jgi:hypothetical protein